MEKNIKKLQVSIKTTATIGLENEPIPQRVYEALKTLERKGIYEIDTNFELSPQEIEVVEWIESNSDYGDAHSWEYRIDDIEFDDSED